MNIRHRLAFIVSHPVQYYVPLYRRLAQRNDIESKVFFTWHGGEQARYDPGFERDVLWDIPLTSGYEYEVVPNVSRRAGSDRFWGIRNPNLVDLVSGWRPDIIHLTGYAFASHLRAMRSFHRRGVPVLFRGDSHLLDELPGVRSSLKRLVLGQVYSWVAGCLYVGKNNYNYFHQAGVPESRLFYCPHSIEVDRFSEPNEVLEQKAQSWRQDLQIAPDQRVLLFAGKFEAKKRPIELMSAVAEMQDRHLVLIMVGNGELEGAVREIANRAPAKFRIIPFQNQSLMPVVYRLGDVVILPSAHDETWGLAVNEAIASGRRVLVSDKVGCACDLVKSSKIGEIFATDNWTDFASKAAKLLDGLSESSWLRNQARSFDTEVAERHLIEALQKVIETRSSRRVEAT